MFLFEHRIYPKSGTDFWNKADAPEIFYAFGVGTAAAQPSEFIEFCYWMVPFWVNICIPDISE